VFATHQTFDNLKDMCLKLVSYPVNQADLFKLVLKMQACSRVLTSEGD